LRRDSLGIREAHEFNDFPAGRKESARRAFKTRDVVSLKNGVCSYVGRSNRVIKVLGRNIDLTSVEQTLKARVAPKLMNLHTVCHDILGFLTSPAGENRSKWLRRALDRLKLDLMNDTCPFGHI
jgi:hypothetical protein